ncbi:NB-ARC domain-containing protein [Dactylosporangium sp. NBC_01737]|uniref:AfsR/SARP family transcriptional regulator n=1 Tax=Dactylosporangium sp. NBC_01737 TaxID=2975959 RepID=UPI002E13B7A6|nr:NB-ARC domain-containing protein [Dactylosporangium sp. NBC_01737]
MLQANLLGPVEIFVAGRQLDLGPAKQRAVLAALLVDAGRPTDVSMIVDRVWGADAPAAVGSSVRSYVARLRRALTEAGTGAGLLMPVRRPAGYVAQLPTDQVDLHRFRRLVNDARQQQGEEQRVELLAEALGLWRGPALADVAGLWADRVRQSLEHQRVDALLLWARAMLDLDRPDEVTGALHELTANSPLVEPVVALLMEALARCGRAAEALTCYAQTRQRLRDALGTDPGEQLRRIHQAILRDEFDRPAVTPVEVSVRPRPAQLPLDVTGFVGRQAEVAVLDSFTHQPAVVAIWGTPGVGKTALAVHWAHRVATEFPDGQLYVNLHGFAPDGPPLDPLDVMRGFLNALGVPAQQIPADTWALGGLYRSTLADRRMLLVLDNAASAEQVRPLLPGSGSCAVVVTSRIRLAGLVVDGACPLHLDLFSDAEAHALLARRIERGRLDRARPAAQAIVAACDRLPLALAVVATRIAVNTHIDLATLARELQEPGKRLDALDDDDQATHIRAVFSWSYRVLNPPTARMFRLIALHPGDQITVTAAASLAGVATGGARRALVELTAAHLLSEPSADRYALHNLLREYARELAQVHETPQERTTACVRLLDHYLHSSNAADQMMLKDAHPPLDLQTATAGVTPDSFTDNASAAAWLTTETSNLHAAMNLAVAIGSDRHIWQLNWALSNTPHRPVPHRTRDRFQGRCVKPRLLMETELSGFQGCGDGVGHRV